MMNVIIDNASIVKYINLKLITKQTNVITQCTNYLLMTKINETL